METETTRTPLAAIDERWLKDWLRGWRLGDRIPEAVTISRLQAVATTLEDQPATQTEFWVVMEPLFKLADTFGLPTPTTPAIQLYWQVMQDLPAWAVSEAVETLIKTWKWGNRLPLPAEVREQVPSTYLSRLRLRRSAEMALSRLTDQIAIETRDSASEQDAEMEKHWALWRRKSG